jgi:hypothetical protein
MQSYNIVPVTVFGKTYNRLEISPVTALLNSSASWESKVYTVDGDPAQASVKQHHIEGAAYDAWGNDDQYIIDRTLEDVGVELAA